MSEDPSPSRPLRPKQPGHPYINPPVPKDDGRTDPPAPEPPHLVEPPPRPAPKDPPPDPVPSRIAANTNRKAAFGKINFGKAASVLTILALVLLGNGCSSGNARLETGGAYAVEGRAPDYSFYAVESSYALALAAFKTASRLEIENRDMFWKISPTIKHTLDEIRPKALEADRTYSKARVAYLKNPTADGLTGLQTILGQIQQLATAAVAAVPTKP